MLSSFLATVTCLAIPVTEPLETPAVMSEGTAAVEVGVHVTPTSFRSRRVGERTSHSFTRPSSLALYSIIPAPAGLMKPIAVTLPVCFPSSVRPQTFVADGAAGETS